MEAREITRDHVKRWVVNNAKINNPYKRSWTAAISLGYDYYGRGHTIEKAYNDIVDRIMKSPYIMSKLVQINSFKEIVRQSPKL